MMESPNQVGDVEELVRRLYRSGPAGEIAAINDQLQQLQRSTAGWQLADTLMASDDANVRFFAALTFQVKLNNDGPSLDAETAQAVKSRLLYWATRLTNQGEGSLVTRKVCSTLATYFVRSPVPWAQPFVELATSLRTNDAASVSTADGTVSLISLLLDLTSAQIVALLTFAAAIADEVSKVNVDSSSHALLHAQMEVLVADVSLTAATAFSSSETKVKVAALNTFLTWVNYAQPVWPRKPEPLQHLRNLTESVAHCVTDPETYPDALEVLCDILESYTSFMTPRAMASLSRLISEYVQPVLIRALENTDPEALPYAQMVIAFGTANVEEIVEQPETEVAKTILSLLIEIVKAPGYPGSDDCFSSHSIEFWNTYVEYINDTVGSQDADELPFPWLEFAKAVLLQLAGLLAVKICLPPGQIAREWSSDETDAFREFRLDATDLMLSIYVSLGRQMTQQVVVGALQSLEKKEWRPMEANLFCLNTIADNVLEDPNNEDLIWAIFDSSLFRDVGDGSLPVPIQVRRTTIDLLGSYGSYIERHAEHLPDALRFLFASLENTQLLTSASKSIASLCSTCRSSLTGELDAFLEQYQRVLGSMDADPYAKEKVLGAIAAIIQAVKPEHSQLQPLLSLISNVERDIQFARSCAAAGDMGRAETVGVNALACLASIGKNMQVPDDVPINIYDDDAEEVANADSFWESEAAQEVRQRIIGCFSILEVLGDVGDAIDAVCQVLRSGYAETQPGPFVLPPSVTVSFFEQCSVTTPQIDSVLSTVCILITQHSKSDSKQIPREIDAICGKVVGLIQQLGQPSQDPAVSHGCIEVLERMIPHYMHLLVGEGSQAFPYLSTLLDFTLHSLEGQDLFPKRAACHFWIKLLQKPGTPYPLEVAQRVDHVITTYGPQLALALMRQMGGLGQRSELDLLCEPLKLLIFTQPAAKIWLESALFSDAFPPTDGKVGQVEKKRFLQQIIALRGEGKKTKDIVKAFYAACRGTVVSYR